jgi:23S rRNA pseudouridine2605 synthase
VLREQLGRRLAAEAGTDFDSDMPEVAAAQKKPVNPKLRAAAPGKALEKDSPRRSREKKFRFEDDETLAAAEAERRAAPRQDRPGGRFAKRPAKPVEARPERERDIRVVHFEDGTEGEHEVKFQRERAEKRWDPDDSSARNFGRPAHHDRKPREEGEDRPKRSFSDRPKRSFGDKPGFGDRKFGDRPPRGDRPFGDRPPRDGDRKFGDKKFGDKKFTGKPGFGNRGRARAAGEGDDARPARSFGGRTRSARPFDDGGDRPERKFGDKRPFSRAPREDGDRPSRGGFGKKPYAPRGDAGERPARSSGGKKPYGATRGDGDRPARTYTAGTKPAYGDKPGGRGGKPGGKPGGARPHAGRPGGLRPAGGAGEKPRGPRKPRG